MSVKAITGKFASRLSLALVIVMVLSIITPIYATEGAKSTQSVAISSFTDTAGNLYINAGRGEGIHVGSKGSIVQNGMKVADYEVVQVNWGISRIAISNRAEGTTIRAGDEAPITSIPQVKKKSSKFKKWIWWALGIGLATYLLTRNHGGGSSDSGTGITLKAEKTTSYSDTNGDSSVVTITAAIRDANGDLVTDGTRVDFSSTVGTLNHTTTVTSGGIATATLTGKTTDNNAVVKVTCNGSTASTTVSFGVSIKLEVSPATIQITNGGGTATSSTIKATCSDAQGNAATSGTVKFTASVGTLSNDSVSISSGVATTTLTSTKAGSSTITATWSGTSATDTVKVTAGPPYSISLSSGSSSLSCDGNSNAAITATVKDSGGNLVTDGTVVNFSVATDSSGGVNGSITSQSETSNGIATASLVTKDSSGNKSTPGTATVTAAVASSQSGDVPAPASGSGVSATTTVKFVSSEVGSVSVSADKTNIRGLDIVGNTTTLTAIVANTQGDAVPDGTAVTFTATHGMISNTTTTTNGKATATLTSNASGGDGNVTVTATAGSITSSSVTVIFSGAPATANCSVEISPDTLASSGGQAVITVTAKDINGHAMVDGTEVTSATSKGTLLSSTAQTSDGMATFTLSTSTDSVTPTEAGAGTVTVTIPAGGAGSSVTLTASFEVLK
ncbi:MAG: invasin domain 3-containing protein [Armatimonadota bacterium]